MSSAAPTTAPRSALDEAIACLRQSFAVRPSEGLSWLSIVAPAAPVESMLGLWRGERGVLYAPEDGAAFAGVGLVEEEIAEGPPQTLRPAAQALLDRIRSVVTAEGADAFADRPRLFGGFAFDAEASVDAPWTSFGKGRLVLPRFTYRREGDRATLSIAFGREQGLAQLENELREIFDHLARKKEPASRLEAGSTTEASEAALLSPPSADDADQKNWIDRVEAITSAIEAGRLRKVVAARGARLLFDRPLDEIGILARLRTHQPGSTRFAIRRDGCVFLGATPERLVERHGERVSSEALAGTMARGKAAELLHSAKEGEEHSLVVETLLEALGPVCRTLHHDPEPRLRKLRDVLHMQTRVEGELRDPLHILDLVGRLHPTPAVGGAPRDAALAWIREHEPVERGWYSGPFGWLDAAGEGSFVVALRCGVVCGSEAWMYAGSGIVRDSKAEAEREEIALKMRTLGETLGGG